MKAHNLAYQPPAINQIAQSIEQALFSPKENSVDSLIMHLLRAVRVRLELEVAFVSQFINGRRLFRYVDSARDVDIIQVGGSDPLDSSYCARIVSGEFPELMKDANALPQTHVIAATQALPVGAHLSVPIRLSDGTIYGTFCAFSRRAKDDLDERDLAYIRVFSDITSSYLEQGNRANQKDELLKNRIKSLVQENRIVTVFQPICRITDGVAVGYEALTRVTGERWAPDILFDQATHVGLGVSLGAHSISCALQQSRLLPGNPYISLNATPEVILSGMLEQILDKLPDCSHLVLEITEHDIVQDYQSIAEILLPLRKRGLRLAVDDAGAGYASFRHILLLKPEIIKLDISLIRDIDQNAEKRALTAALVEFSKHSQYLLVAEGVETSEELQTLKILKVDYAQGYFLSRPYPPQHFRGQSANRH